MSELIAEDESLTMSSLEISKLTGKRHDHVMRDIRVMLLELHGEGGVLSFGDTHRNQQNGQDYPIFQLPKRETLILVSGYNLQMRARIIDRWQELEAAAAKSAMERFAIPQTLHDALRLAADLAEDNAMTKARNAVLEQTVAEQAPKAAFADMVAGADGAHTMTEVAKILGIGRNTLFQILRERHVFAGTTPYQQHIAAGRFVVRERPYVRGGESRLYAQTFVTGKGLQFIQRLVDQPLLVVH